MRAVVQRCLEASVTAPRLGQAAASEREGERERETTGRVARGLVAFVGAGEGDEVADAAYLARKLARLRVFPDEAGRMARSLLELQSDAPEAGLLAISQFTVFGDVRRGNRPGFDAAMPPEQAEPLLERFYALCRGEGLRVATGRFRADMRVLVVNDGPVTILLDSKRLF